MLLLGPVEVEIAGRRMRSFESRKAVALLGYLARQSQPAARSQLATLLWGDRPEAHARRNLSRELSQLAAALPGTFAADYHTIALAPGAAELVDTARFEAVAASARGGLSARAAHADRGPDRARWFAAPGAPVADPAPLAAAVALYRGEFMAGLAIDGCPELETWLLREREHWQRQVAGQLARLVAHHGARREDEAAQRYARRWLDLEPWQEEAHRALMLLLALGGRRAQALAQYDACRRALAETLDVEPAEETAALAEQIRSGAIGAERLERQVGAPAASSPAAPAAHGDAPRPGRVVGREAELRTLGRWVDGDECQVVGIVGLGGVGKSALAAQLVADLAGHFDHVLWRSLLNAPPLADLLQGCAEGLATHEPASLPASLDGRLDLLLALLRGSRCLVVLDGFEHLLRPGERAGSYRPGYEGYGQLVARLGQSRHPSCLLLISRERPLELDRLAGADAPVRVLQLAGLGPEAGAAVMREHGLGDAAGQSLLVERYSGSPLALRLAAVTIRDLFGGDVASFLRQGPPIFDDIREVLDQQVARLSVLERDLLVWLALERAPAAVPAIQAGLAADEPRVLLEALRSLQRRSLLEHAGERLTLPRVVMEHTTEALVARVVQEIERGQPDLLARHALVRPLVGEEVRQRQAGVILAPIAARLVARLGRAELLERLSALPGALPAGAELARWNLRSLLAQLGADLHGPDRSQLAV